jgi:hypothetical protein
MKMSDLEKEPKQINCRYCDEKISINAKKCKHCGEILDPQLREIELLKNQRNQQIFMQGGSSSSSSAAVAVTDSGKRTYPWLLNLLLTLVTGGLWLLIWLPLYLLRDRTKYH